jgi:hypothetical protein
MDLKFYKEALFGGMTGNAFKLGMVLTGGWFWVRVSGCAVLYRGESLSTIDFDNILAVGDSVAGQISAPGWLEHRAEGRYLYAVRRANGCGMIEYGLRGVAVIVFDNEGLLCRPAPNGVFGLAARRAASGRAELGWYYCPLGQEAEPASFKIYSDNGSGQVDFENQVGVVEYKGKGFYSFAADFVIGGACAKFAVRAEDEKGIASFPAVVNLEPGYADIPKVRITGAEAL